MQCFDLFQANKGNLGFFFRQSVTLLDVCGFITCVSCYARHFSQTDFSRLAILFYISLVQVPMGFFPALSSWVTPTLADAPWIAATGASGLVAHYCMTRAFRVADATLVVPIDFLRLPLIAVVGLLLYGEPIETATFVGAVVIFAGTYYSIRRESR